MRRYARVRGAVYPAGMFLFREKTKMIEPERALPGRDTAMPLPERHDVLGTPIAPPFPEQIETLVVGMGCFWGAERLFWQLPGVYTTAVGYAGGFTPNPTYEEVCSGSTGHTEVVLVAFDPAKVSLDSVLRTFWEGHDPTQGMRQGNDVGTQYRSAIYYGSDEQKAAIEASRERFQAALSAAGHGEITTEIAPAGPFYYAEAYHQQYLDKHPGRLLRPGRHGRLLPGRAGRSGATGLEASLDPPRRGGRAVECTGLENRSPFTRTAGSNPAPSAPDPRSLVLAAEAPRSVRAYESRSIPGVRSLDGPSRGTGRAPGCDPPAAPAVASAVVTRPRDVELRV